LNKSDEARALYQQLLNKNASSARALTGLGDTEMELARGTSGQVSIEHYKQAVSHYKAALDVAPTSRDVLDLLTKAQVGQAKAEAVAAARADLQAENERLRLILYTAGAILAVAAAIGIMLFLYRWRRPRP
jgi:hypothetical protein